MSMAITLIGNSVVGRPLYKITKPTPLVGLEFIGLIDRPSNLIEIRPITGCLLDCVYCWISNYRQNNDFIIAHKYLTEWFRKLALLRTHPVQAYITAHGDPLLYPELLKLVKSLKKIANTVSISCHIANLDYEILDKLSAYVDRMNITLDTLRQDRVLGIYNKHINLKEKLSVLKYATALMDITITPVIMPYINKDEASSFISWVKKNIPKRKQPRLLFQKYISYSNGKKLASGGESFKNFREWVSELQTKNRENLTLRFKDLGIVRDKNSENVFKYGEVVTAKILAPGRVSGHWIASAKQRLLLCYSDNHLRLGSKLKVRITHAFNNTYKCRVL